MKHVEEVVAAVVRARAHKATKYISPREVICACQRRVDGRVPRKGKIEIVLTIGRPNYQQRDYIRRLKAAGERFPVRQMQLQFAPRRKK